MIPRLAFTGHHADIVTADQRIQSGYPGERGFWRHQPELGLFTQRVVHVAFDAGANFNFAAVAGQADILHRTYLNALETDRRAAGDNTIRRHKVDGNGGAPIFVAIPDKPAGNHQRDDRQ